MDGRDAFDARQALRFHDAGSLPQLDGGEQSQPGHLSGHVLGGCRLIHLINAGGMGEVYLAEQMRLGNRFVAVKVVRPEDAVAPRLPGAPSIEARFMREGKLLGRFSHPNILPVHDSGIEDEYLYLVMQYTPDGSLADAIRGTAPHRLNLPVRLPLAVDIIQQIASALQYTHDHGVVHRDVKPANVLVQRELNGHRRMLLADFGIARGMETMVQSNDVSGTATYMAPEQFSGTFFPASDQYGLAVIAYLLLAGRPPFIGNVAQVTRAHMFDAPPPLRSFNSNISSEVEQVVIRALSKHPDERYPSVSAFAQAFRVAATQDDASNDKTIPGTFPPSVMGMALTGTGAVVGATKSQGATRPVIDMRDEGARLQDALIQTLHQPLGPSASAGLPAWLGGADDGARPVATAAAPRRDTQQSDMRRRAVVFVVSAALLALAAVAAIKAGPLYISHGYTSVASPTATSTTSSTPTNVQPTVSPDKANVIAMDAPRTLTPGRRFTISITIANTGTSTWSAGDGYRLVCDTLNHPHDVCPNDLAASMGNRTIAPGERAQFRFPVIAPSRPGTYTIWVNMARNGALFGTPDVAVRFVVQSPPPAPTVPYRPTPTPKPHPSPTATPRPAPTATPAPTAPPSPVPTATPLPVPTATVAPAPTNTTPPAPTATTSP